MRLKYDSKKPRRVEILVMGGEIIDVPKTIGETLAKVTGFTVTRDKNTEPEPTPFEHLEAVTAAVTGDTVDDELVNAVLALAATLSPEDDTAPADAPDKASQEESQAADAVDAAEVKP